MAEMSEQERTDPVPGGYTHVELPKPQARGWGKFWDTLSEALEEPEKDKT